MKTIGAFLRLGLPFCVTLVSLVKVWAIAWETPFLLLWNHYWQVFSKVNFPAFTHNEMVDKNMVMILFVLSTMAPILTDYIATNRRHWPLTVALVTAVTVMALELRLVAWAFQESIADLVSSLWNEPAFAIGLVGMSITIGLFAWLVAFLLVERVNILNQ